MENKLKNGEIYSHANFPKLTDTEFHDQIIKADKLISQFAGYTPNIVRPPYGKVNEGQIQWLASQHKKL
ncbi:polysaccharide deacetylase family protein [Aneurinibacillus migulanus]|uniref:polysaccharide deacetylase family protein n=1 Tax=Aneurinibacillus migulanus TaxID=47500 RepID=UPI00094270DA|nr:polysaccharide deacetylase family protein [Aneurinibacillus migulanus]GED16151.1 hypothetical protein AMI01nite_41420 [Aneurinibacillus migulanus]